MIGKRQLVTFSLLTLTVLSALLLIAAHPAQAATETVLYNFCSAQNCTDGDDPQSGLTFHAGNLYGTTCTGGLWQAGTVFELSPNGGGGWNETVLYSFTGEADGGCPYANVTFDSAGNLYGTTPAGGIPNGGYGAGVVFELSPAGSSWTETTAYSFQGGADGEDPYDGLILDSAGNFYGINSAGVFELTPSGGGWAEQVIYPDTGGGGYANLTMDPAGNMFGVFANPTGNGPSSAFELSPNGSGGWNPSVIYTFPGYSGDGSNPEGTPVLDQAGNLYGTTTDGGSANGGTVYKLSPGKTGWTEEILYSFKTNGTDGYDPIQGLVFDAAGNLYGSTFGGGKNGLGAVYELTPGGNGKYKEKVLSSFTPSGSGGAYPFGTLIMDSAGNLYGTTANGGTTDNGVVFEVHTVVAVKTTTTLTSSPNPSADGQAVTFTAEVTSSRGAPPNAETVSFLKGKTVLGTGALSGGTATFVTSTLKVGTTSVTAVYAGDSQFLGSKSKPVKQVVQ